MQQQVLQRWMDDGEQILLLFKGRKKIQQFTVQLVRRLNGRVGNQLTEVRPVERYGRESKRRKRNAPEKNTQTAFRRAIRRWQEKGRSFS